MSQHTFSKLILRDDIYVDAVDVTDEEGYAIIEVPNTAIMVQWRERFGIDHWCESDRAFIELTLEQQKANARRIVACVNACAGLQTDALERLLSIGGRLAAADLAVDSMDRQLEQAVQQRDELLSVVEEFTSVMQECYDLPDTASSQENIARVAGKARKLINELEGGAA